MQINNNIQMQGVSTPNFKAIKSVKCEGLYKKYPEYARKLVDTLKDNKIAMDFCNKYDVDIVFFAAKRAMTAVESSINIFFKNPSKNKFLGIFGNKKDQIELTGFGNLYNIDDSLRASTNKLTNYLLPGIKEPTTGVLNAHLMLKEKEIAEAMNKKNKNLTVGELKKAWQVQLQKDSLNDSIDDLIKQSK